jgi:hypothetical protein
MVSTATMADHSGRSNRQHGEGAERADHQDVAVGEVDQAHDAVDHGEADRDQGVERAEHQPVEQLLEDIGVAHGPAPSGAKPR